MKRVLVAVALIAVLAGCSTDNFRDIEGVQSHDPDKVEVYNNVDQNPNVTMICIHGVAFVTTTRDYDSILRVRELDRQCPGGASQ